MHHILMYLPLSNVLTKATFFKGVKFDWPAFSFGWIYAQLASWAKFKSKFVPVQAHVLETSCFTCPNLSPTHAVFVIIWAQSETW